MRAAVIHRLRHHPGRPPQSKIDDCGAADQTQIFFNAVQDNQTATCVLRFKTKQAIDS